MQAGASGETEGASLGKEGAAEKRNLDKPKSPRLAESTLIFNVNAPADRVWDTLVDFDAYPSIFKRIKTCTITKRDGDAAYVETYLKPQMFVKQSCQHTVNYLRSKPERLEWRQLDGNFKHVEGSWDIQPIQASSTSRVTYNIKVDAGQFVPSPLVSFLLKFVQKEVAKELKSYIETGKRVRKP